MSSTRMTDRQWKDLVKAYHDRFPSQYPVGEKPPVRYTWVDEFQAPQYVFGYTMTPAEFEQSNPAFKEMGVTDARHNVIVPKWREAGYSDQFSVQAAPFGVEWHHHFLFYFGIAKDDATIAELESNGPLQDAVRDVLGVAGGCKPGWYRWAMKRKPMKVVE